MPARLLRRDFSGASRRCEVRIAERVGWYSFDIDAQPEQRRNQWQRTQFSSPMGRHCDTRNASQRRDEGDPLITANRLATMPSLSTCAYTGRSHGCGRSDVCVNAGRIVLANHQQSTRSHVLTISAQAN
mgnify:CR=1